MVWVWQTPYGRQLTARDNIVLLHFLLGSKANVFSEARGDRVAAIEMFLKGSIKWVVCRQPVRKGD